MKNTDTQKKEKIIEAVYHITWLEGLQKVSMLGISKRVGISVGTIYNYFPSKEALIEAAYRAIETKSISQAMVGVTDAMPYKDKIRTIYLNSVRYHVNAYEEYYFAELCRKQLFNTEDNKQNIKAIFHYYGAFITLFQEGKQKEYLVKTDTILITLTFLNAIRGVSFAIRKQIVPFKEEVLEQHFQIIWKGISI